MFLFLLPILAVAGILYFLISEKSIPAVRRAAIIALALVLLSIMVCSIFILGRSVTVTGPGYSPEDEIPVTPVPPPNLALLIGMALVFLLFVILIAVAARREQRRQKNG